MIGSGATQRAPLDGLGLRPTRTTWFSMAIAPLDGLGLRPTHTTWFSMAITQRPPAILCTSRLVPQDTTRTATRSAQLPGRKELCAQAGACAHLLQLHPTSYTAPAPQQESVPDALGRVVIRTHPKPGVRCLR
ncbi:hypothetical protein NDU88_003489 [Pleurodeles waltl]|uniref:Uncharacterized protein n=1 Tax=Pleurodeles waltl TaxID=8319 RepID=A0AAV7REF5_PLEWA|nr:hypothetical protein NDU88_003489 [Pleurodeles waltl]